MKFKFDLQKVFCFASLFFILGCIIIYGGTFINLYLENEKALAELDTVKPFYEQLINNNYDSENFAKIDKTYYFKGNATNNYISYSNLLWRIVKINEDNSLVLVTDNVIGTLAYGNINTPYQDSNISNWLNNTETGKFIKILNDKEKYLKLTNTCTDTISSIENITCNNIVENQYLGLLSLNDYLNTGGNTSFINNGKYTYLANKNEEQKIWYITNNGSIDTTDGNDILGIKPTITLLSTINMLNGNGTIENPYTFEESKGLIGSYVKLNQDLWRIYEEKEGIVKLVLQDTIKENNIDIKHIYSNDTYYHNDTIKNSLAYYLNKNYYDSLSYKDLILETNYVNGLYGKENNYNYQDISTKTIKTKITTPSLEDIIFNDNLNDYFTNTGKIENQEAIYIQKANGITSTKLVISENNIVPCISIKQEKLTLGTGTQTDPYRTE